MTEIEKLRKDLVALTARVAQLEQERHTQAPAPTWVPPAPYTGNPKGGAA